MGERQKAVAVATAVFQGILDGVKRASLAGGGGFAKFFSHADDEGVVFVEKGTVLGHVVCQEPLHRVVVGGLVDQAMTVQNPFGVSVDDKNGFAQGVQQNRVRGLGADAVDG